MQEDLYLSSKTSAFCNFKKVKLEPPLDYVGSHTHTSPSYFADRQENAYIFTNSRHESGDYHKNLHNASLISASNLNLLLDNAVNPSTVCSSYNKKC